MEYTAIMPVVRMLMQAVGGALIARGWLDASALDPFIGVGINAGALAWWLIDRRRGKTR